MRPMKTLLLCTTALAGVATVASAADLPVRKAPPRAVAAPVVSTWTGCYVGGHIGGGWSRTNFDNNVFSLSNPDLGDFSAGLDNESVNADGFLGGVQGGCNYQFYPNWVIGIEGTFSWADLNGSTTRTPFDPFSEGEGGTLTVEVKKEWLATLVGRLGYTQANWMLYALGGIAWVRDKYRVSGSTTFDFEGVAFDLSRDETRTGYVVGVGLTALFWTNVSGFIEYNYLDFGSHRVDLTGTATNEFLGSSGPATLSTDVTQRIHVFKAGLNWHFGGFGKGPVVARY